MQKPENVPVTFAKNDVEIIARETLYSGFFSMELYRFRHRLFNGEMSGEIKREIFERGHAAVLLPFDPVRDEVVLVEQIRIAAYDTSESPWLLEMVAGMIEEGESVEDVARREALEEAGLVRLEDFRAVITDPAFLRHYGIPFDSAEGFLMPDTYLLKKADVPDKAQARAVAGRMVDNFWRKGDALWPDGKRPSRDELRRLVILASVVEKETAFADERPRVAGVYANRLRINMALQADPTVIYGLGPNFDGNLRRRHLDDANNIYNTYQRPGLPPGPICSFGASALAAAITPEEHKYLYFVAITDGGRHAFSTNLDDHNRAVRQYLKNRRAQRQQ